MQPLDGLDFFRLARTGGDRSNHYIQMIMVTGHSEHQCVTLARDAGTSEVLIKPLSAKSLYSQIKAVIERPRPFVETSDYFGEGRREAS